MIWLQLAVIAVDLFLFGTVLFLLALMSAWVYSMSSDVPFVPTPREHFLQLTRALGIKDGDTVYELGSGDGRFLLWAAHRYPLARFFGIERNPLLHLYAVMNRWFTGAPKNLAYVRGNLFNADLTFSNKLYAYLLPEVMDRLLPSLEKKFHGRLASRAFQFKDRQATAAIELSQKPGSHGEHMLYVYDF